MLKKQFLRYWLAMNATAFDGAVHALIIYMGTATGHTVAEQLDLNVAALTLQQLVLVFASAFGLQILKYLDAHPLEALLAPGTGSAPAPAAQMGGGK